MNRLIVLLTDSNFDRRVLSSKANWPGQDIDYLDCDTGLRCDEKPMDVERLLCIVLKDASRDTNGNNLQTVLAESRGFDAVIGVHCFPNDPSTEVDVSIADSRPVVAYTTAVDPYSLVPAWCEALASRSPDAKQVQAGFEQLFSLIKAGTRPKPVEPLRAIKHRLMNMFSAIRTDLQGWPLSGFAPEYFQEIAKQHRALSQSVLEQARRILYVASPKPAMSSLKHVVEEYLMSWPDPSDEVRDSWRRIQDLLPASNSPSPSTSPLFTKVAKILECLRNQTAADDLRQQLERENSYDAWFVAFERALDTLVRSMRKTEVRRTGPQPENLQPSN